MCTPEALLQEMKPYHAVYPILRAAQESFFGDHILYTHPNLEPSSSEPKEEEPAEVGKAKEHKKGKKEKKGKAKDEVVEKVTVKQVGAAPVKEQASGVSGSAGADDDLHTIVQDAKAIIQHALEINVPGRSKKAQQQPPCTTPDCAAMAADIAALKKSFAEMRTEIDELKQLYRTCCAPSLAKQPPTEKAAEKIPEGKAPSAPVKEEAAEEDFDLFGSSDEEEDAEKERVKQERLKAYAEKKAKKPASVAKSSVILDIKPWDDETDMAEMENKVRSMEIDGLVWGGGKLIPLAYGIKKLQIICVIEDEKVSVDDLIDSIVEDFSDYVQSVDIAAFNKI